MQKEVMAQVATERERAADPTQPAVEVAAALQRELLAERLPLFKLVLESFWSPDTTALETFADGTETDTDKILSISNKYKGLQMEELLQLITRSLSSISGMEGIRQALHNGGNVSTRKENTIPELREHMDRVE